MAKCQYCNANLPNNKPIAFRCTNCGTVWCSNGICVGSAGRKQMSRMENALCVVCQKRAITKV